MPEFNPELLAKWCGGEWLNGCPARLTGVSTDTRTLQPGDLFVAIKGPNFNGHDFVREAFSRGAAGAVVTRTFQSDPSPGLLLGVDDPLVALQAMARAYRRQIGVKIVAVTGSVGKTTIKEMTADVLASKMRVARTRGNWNNELGLPLSILRMDPQAQVGVFEVGMNHPGELAPLCRILAPDWGLVGAIGPVHLEFFNSVEDIAREKASLLASLSHEKGVSVIRRDDPWFKLLRETAPGRVITLAFEGDADYRCTALLPDNQVQITETASGEVLEFRSPLPGRHQILNAMYAVAVGRGHGLEWDDIRSALEHFHAPPMRWDCRNVKGVTIINDAYNANPVSMVAALSTFSELPVQGQRWLVLGGMRELGVIEVPAHLELGRMLAAGSWGGLVTVGALGRHIADGAQQAGMDAARIFSYADAVGAAEILKRKIRTGDAVLLKASRGEHLEKVIEMWIPELI